MCSRTHRLVSNRRRSYNRVMICKSTSREIGPSLSRSRANTPSRQCFVEQLADSTFSMMLQDLLASMCLSSNVRSKQSEGESVRTRIYPACVSRLNLQPSRMCKLHKSILYRKLTLYYANCSYRKLYTVYMPCQTRQYYFTVFRRTSNF
jgi:hypothetical protein